MRILKLLEGLYLELKVFNENVEYFSCLKHEKECRQENPLKTMTDTEIIALKIWINKQLKEKNITFNSNTYEERHVNKFLDLGYRKATKPVRDLISAALGYGSFNDLLVAYRQQEKKEGAA